MWTSRILGATLLLLACAGPIAAGQVSKIRDTGPDSNRLILVLTGDGYQGTERATFDADAADAVNLLLTRSPWQEYASYLNVYTDFVPSFDSGADKPSPCWGNPVLVNTFYNSTYCYQGVQRLLVASTSLVISEVDVAVPNWDVIGVIVNDREYGGSGGSVLTFSTEARAGEIFLHEAGHTFAGLADEYTTPLAGAPRIDPEPNVELDTTFDDIKWNVWIEPGTPLPTPATEPDFIGAYEGARYYREGIFRPEFMCMMKALSTPFCSICKESHVQSLYTYVSPVDGVLPAPGDVPFDSCENLFFQLFPMTPDPQTIMIEWRLNGVPIPGEDRFDLILQGRDLPDAGYVLEAVVRDQTPLVRRPYLDPMQDTRVWSLVRTSPAGDLDGDTLDDACDPDIDGDGALNDDDCWPRDDTRIDEPVPEVPDLRVGQLSSGQTRLSWTDVLGPMGTPEEGQYLFASGLLGDMSADAGFAGACAMSGARQADHLDPRSGPGQGEGYYYLVLGSNGCGPGEIGGSSPPPPDAREGIVWADLPPCP